MRAPPCPPATRRRPPLDCARNPWPRSRMPFRSTHFINSVGAKAGFASIIGLALLVLLFFTQSRETANLRRRADEAEQQLYQLQLYVDHLSRQRSQQAAAPLPQRPALPSPPRRAAALAARAAAREPRRPGRAGPRRRRRGHAIPAAPAGVGAPALSSATRLIPLAEPDEISIRALEPSDQRRSARVTSPTPPSRRRRPPRPAAPPPSTAAGGGNGVARPPVVPMPTMAAPQPTRRPRVALPRQQRAAGRAPAAAPRRTQRGRRRRISPRVLRRWPASWSSP